MTTTNDQQEVKSDVVMEMINAIDDLNQSDKMMVIKIEVSVDLFNRLMEIFP